MKNLKHLAIYSLVVALLMTSCRKADQNSQSPSSAGNQLLSADGENIPTSGYVYIESNESDTNRILIYDQHRDGSLTLRKMLASGGMGTGTGLGSQGSLALDRDHDRLYAVNAGSNTISSFKVWDNGNLTLDHTDSSGGMLPISITVHSGLVYVLNAASANISGFASHPEGNLIPIAGSTQSLSGSGTSPEQIGFSPDGQYVYVTEKAGNHIDVYAINSQGQAAVGVFTNATGINPYGFAFSYNRFMIVSNAAGGNANASTVTSYKGVESGNLNPVNGAMADSETAACWLTTTANGRYAYVCNAGSNNISIFKVSDEGKLTLLNANAAPGDHPIDIIVTGNDSYVYNINYTNQTIGEFKRGTNGSLTGIGTVTGLPAPAGGLVGF